MAPNWYAEVKSIMDEYGVPEPVWVPIVIHESGGNPYAVNDTRGRTDLPAGTVPEYSVGLFQINLLARGIKPEEVEQYAAQYKDPAFAARWAAPRLATAYKALKDTLNMEPVSTWAAHVAVRSGWPGGSLEFPCRSSLCTRVMSELTSIANKWIGGGFTVKGFDFSGGGTTGGDRPAGGGSPIIPGLAAGGVTPFTSWLGGIIGSPVDRETAGDIGLRLSVFIIGLVIFTIAIGSILYEPIVKTAKAGAGLARDISIAGTA